MIRVFSTILIAVLVLTAAFTLASCEPADCAHEVFTEEVAEPNCTSGGYVKHTCDTCGYVWHDTFTEVNGECSFEIVETVPSTCTELGYVKEACVLCGDEKVTYEKDYADHTYGEWTLVTEPGCEVLGLETRTCSVCEDVEERELDFVHFYDGGYPTAPTCTENGFVTYTCTSCGHSYETVTDGALGHTMGEWFVSVEQTCESMGEMKSECSICDYYETLEIDPHFPEVVEVVEPTHTNVGYTIYRCTECEKEFASDHVPALGHGLKDSDWHDMEGAEGWQIRECECGYYEIRAKKN